MASKLESIVTTINEVIQSELQKDNLLCNGTMLFRGIVKPTLKNGEIINTIQGEKNLQNVVFLDKHTLQVYHKVISPMQITKDTTGTGEYMQGVARLNCIIYTKHDRFYLLEKFENAFPTIQNVKGLTKVVVRLNSTNINEPQIFAGERGNIDYNLNPEWQLAAIEYTIDYRYNAKC